MPVSERERLLKPPVSARPCSRKLGPVEAVWLPCHFYRNRIAHHPAARVQARPAATRGRSSPPEPEYNPANSCDNNKSHRSCTDRWTTDTAASRSFTLRPSRLCRARVRHLRPQLAAMEWIKIIYNSIIFHKAAQHHSYIKHL